MDLIDIYRTFLSAAPDLQCGVAPLGRSCVRKPVNLAVSKIIESLANGPFLRNPAVTWLWSSHQSLPTGAGHLSLPCLPVSSPVQDS